MTDVAREAGVSLATASRALNGSSRRVREDLRRRVLTAADKLAYAPNGPAQAMARGSTNVLGLLVHDIADPYFSSIATGVMRAADERQLVVTIFNTLRRPDREVEYVRTLRGQRACALIVAGSRIDDSLAQDQLEHELAEFESAGGRAVFISQGRQRFDTVVLENRAGARVLAESLAELGHRRFLVLAGPPEVRTSTDRVQGFREGLARHSIQLSRNQVLRGEFTRDGGFEAMTKAFDLGLAPDCVFAVNDVMAVGAMAACRHRGVRVPEDLAVAGFDDIATLRDVTPSLTTVQMPLDDVGAMALELVLAERADHPRLRRVKGQVVLRDSTSRAR
ncbi:LacI family DNA-binding transcriptional regulator [Micromonospora sp. NPDC051296]|uniref:LacI family DNA-binding transcriptional regulator n=1 Tax=Micromonospora sp. NPDC051296 TaxID=3155046 RepID=UPI003446F76D